MEKSKISTIIGKKIAKYRTLKNMTQAELGEIVGLSSTAISNYETGYSSPRVDMLMEIAEALEMSVENILDKPLLYNEILDQHGYSFNSLPYFINCNINSPEDLSVVLADHCIQIPTKEKYNTAGVFCTDIKDNSMANLELGKGSYIFVKKDIPPHSGNIVALIDKKNKSITARTYSKEGPVVRLLPNGNSDFEPIVTTENDPDYTIVGTVVAKILKIDYFDENNY